MNQLNRYFCTYFDRNYLPQGIALYNSLRRNCPQGHIFVLCLCDISHLEMKERNLPGVTLIGMGELEHYDARLVAVKSTRSKIEYIFTCTSSFCRYIMHNYPEVDMLTYLDADLYFYSCVEPLFEELGSASIGIFSHDFSSSRYLRFGRFNVGWISFRRDANALACIEWWREKCLDWCKDKVEPSRFADQKYLDEWPSRFAGVHIFKHPGANLARWNFKRRKVSLRDGQLRVNDYPLIFFHFASFKQIAPWLFESNFSSHWTRPDRITRREIFGQYIAELRHISGPLMPRLPRRLLSQVSALGGFVRTSRQFAQILRSILLFDYIAVMDLTALDAKFSSVVGPRGTARITSSVARRAIWFAFADANIHSGQREASRLTYGSIEPSKWDVHLIILPGLEQNEIWILRLPRYLLRLCIAWAKYIGPLFEAAPVLHMNIGQSWMSFIRDGIPIITVLLLKPRAQIVVMLQGNLFMTWKTAHAKTLAFAGILRRAQIVTVLGPNQKERLAQLGVSPGRIRICNNTCGTNGISMSEILQKQTCGEPIHVLHLSTLIDTKGYPEFLEALLELSLRPGRRIEAVLCGRILAGEHSERFIDSGTARQWIVKIIARINKSLRVTVRWMDNGADGDAKWALYRKAHVFVLPTHYVVEAQPIVLIEAMAFGCAIITSRAGEILPMFGDSGAALFLQKIAVNEVVEAIDKLVADESVRLQLGRRARVHFEQEFSPSANAKRWNELFAGLPGVSH